MKTGDGKMPPIEYSITVKADTNAIAEDIRVLIEGGVKLSKLSIMKIVEEHIEVIR
jgi:hypothetical protein